MIPLGQWCSNLKEHQNRLKDLLKQGVQGGHPQNFWPSESAGVPNPRISDPVGLGWSPIICIFNKFTGDAEVAGPGTPFKEPQLWKGKVDGFWEPFNNLLLY